MYVGPQNKRLFEIGQILGTREFLLLFLYVLQLSPHNCLFSVFLSLHNVFYLIILVNTPYIILLLLLLFLI